MSWRACLCRRPFPRHACRGLIEAHKPVDHRRRAQRSFRGMRAAASLKHDNHIGIYIDGPGEFPRHACRGLIEAPAPDPYLPSETCFRGMRAAASLKHGVDPRVGQRALEFPRHACRGLIEADAGRCVSIRGVPPGRHRVRALGSGEAEVRQPELAVIRRRERSSLMCSSSTVVTRATARRDDRRYGPTRRRARPSGQHR
jgi:hypothetical protein